MPIPLIPAIAWCVSAAAAAYGAKKSIDAKDNYAQARQRIGNAQDRLQVVCGGVETMRKKVGHQLELLGHQRLKVRAKSLTSLLDLVRQVNQSGDLPPLVLDESEIPVSLPPLHEVESQSYDAIDMLSHGAKALGTGALMGIGAGQAVTALGAASTGTAISALSGAAATNATLAWLGGGSLAAGGLGVSGGTAVLGGVVAGPALLVMGLMAAGKSEEALTEAHRRAAELDVAAEEASQAEDILIAVDLRVREVAWVLTELDKRFLASASRVKRILAKARKATAQRYADAGKEVTPRVLAAKVSFKKLNDADQASYMLMVMLGMALFEVNNVRVLTKNGALTKESAKVVKSNYELLEHV